MPTRTVDKFVQWDPKHRLYRPVFWRREVLPAWLYFDLSDQAGIKTVNAAGTPTPLVSYKQPYTSVNGLDAGLGTPFNVRSLIYQDSTDGTALANFTVLLKEMGEVRQFMNRPVHVRTFAGTSQQPALLREPYLFMSQHNIQCQLAKVAGGATTMRLFLHGAQYYPWSPSFILEKQAKSSIVDVLRKQLNRRPYVWPYWLTTDTDVVLPTTAPTDFFSKIGDDAHFEMFGHSIVMTTTVGTANFGYEISEVKTKQTLMNGVASALAGAGNSFFPTIYATPYMLPAGSRLRIRITNFTAGTLTVFFTFFGRLWRVPIRQIKDVDMDTALPVVPTPADTPTVFDPAPSGVSS